MAKTAASGVAGAGKRVALFMPSLAGGGAERIMLNLAAGFIARGCRVDLVLASAVGEYASDVPAGVRRIDLGAAKPLNAVPALARYLRAERPAALLATIVNANLAALWARRLSGVPMRCVVREASTLSVDLAEGSALNRLLLPRLVARSFRRAEAIVAPSRGVADDFARVTGLPWESIEVIYNPVVSEALRQRALQSADHRWFQGDDIPVIVGMGRLTRQKDFATLIRAFARFRRTTPARLIILGEGEDRGDLEALCRSLGVAADVDLPGFVANPYAILAQARLFVLSSRWEGLPGALIEALACGARVVSTDCPSGPREILDDGRYGQLVPAEDEVAMAAAMGAALDGSFVAADPGAWLDRFDAEANTDCYLELLLGSAGSGRC